jgi:LPXTG-motif cell wall-anchored protein
MSTMLKRLVAATAAGAAALMIPTGAALAHDQIISATCEELSVELFDYSAANTYTVEISVDGSAALSTTFVSFFSWSHAFSDATIDHTYRVAVTSTMSAQGTFDTGVQTIECAESASASSSTTTTTTTTTAASVIAPPTTAVASGAGVAATTTPASVVAAPAAPPTSAVAPAGAAADDSLPATGTEEGPIALVALAGVVLGAALIGTAWRRHADRPS